MNQLKQETAMESTYAAKDTAQQVPQIDAALNRLSGLADEIQNDLFRLSDLSERVVGPKPKGPAEAKNISVVTPNDYVSRIRDITSRYQGIETNLRNLIGELAEAL